VCCSVLQCVAVCCSVLQCVAVCCSVMQCVAVCCKRDCPSRKIEYLLRICNSSSPRCIYIYVCACVCERESEAAETKEANVTVDPIQLLCELNRHVFRKSHGEVYLGELELQWGGYDE